VILLPAIDIRDGHAVRLLRGDYDQETVYDADPAEAAKRWVAEGARYLHIVDLDGARSGRPLNLEAVERIASSVPVPLQAGGGLRDTDAIEALIEAGAERVVLGTAALTDRELLGEAIDAHGERIVVSVDARAGKVVYQGWTQTAEGDAPEVIGELSDIGVRRFVFTPIDVDGTMGGPRIEQLSETAAATQAEIIYSGGVGELDDLRALVASGPPNLGGVIVGRALYERRFTVAEAQAALDSGAGEPS
jgi:phosphoribosylformimino-5-aminoimidazole carboxamide ribotide isomerase